MISRIINVEVMAISLTETLIILDITKTESNNSFIIFKNRRTVARKNIMKIIKTLTDYIQLKNKFSAVRLQPSMDKMEKIDDCLYTKKVRLIKRTILYKTGG